MRLRSILFALPLALLAGAAPAQEKIKVGYWTSGFSVGFGAVLEAGTALEQTGRQPRAREGAGAKGRPKAVPTPSSDAAFAAPVPGAVTLAIQAEGAGDRRRERDVDRLGEQR